jgi:acyl carrier protein
MDKISRILKEIRPEFDFAEGEDFLAQGKLDSFDVLTLVDELERAFDVSIEGVDILPKNLRSMSAIRGLLTQYGVTAWN